MVPLILPSVLQVTSAHSIRRITQLRVEQVNTLEVNLLAAQVIAATAQLVITVKMDQLSLLLVQQVNSELVQLDKAKVTALTVHKEWFAHTSAISLEMRYLYPVSPVILALQEQRLSTSTNANLVSTIT